ncbi:MAG TPA: N-acyl homoserine lactonase family protein [Bryobacteraceae bacterium]
MGKLRWISIFGALACALALAQSAAPFKPASAPKSLRVYVFDGGTLDIPDTAPYGFKPGELGSKNMSIASFLIVHPKGTLMWDTGAVPDRNFKPGEGPATLRYATTKRPLEAQLAEVGYRPSDITYLAISHFHWDHVGNANLFAHSTWLVRKEERDVMFSDPPSTRTEPANFSELKNSKTIFIDKPEYDVFGDGTVIIKAAPGHSPGHQVLFLKLKKTGPVVLSGDLYHYPEERKLGKIPTTEFNAQQTAASRAEVEAFLKKTGAQLWIQHDLIANQKLKKSPAFYE